MADRNRDPQDLTETEARQGVKAHRVSRVLVVSVLGAAVALAVVLSLTA